MVLPAKYQALVSRNKNIVPLSNSMLNWIAKASDHTSVRTTRRRLSNNPEKKNLQITATTQQIFFFWFITLARNNNYSAEWWISWHYYSFGRGSERRLNVIARVCICIAYVCVSCVYGAWLQYGGNFFFPGLACMGVPYQEAYKRVPYRKGSNKATGLYLLDIFEVLFHFINLL